MNLDGDPHAEPSLFRRIWPCGDRCVLHGEPKPSGHGAHSALPRIAVEALGALLESQAEERLLAAKRWQDTGLVFTTHRGAALDAVECPEDVQARMQRRPGIGDGWTPRELRDLDR